MKITVLQESPNRNGSTGILIERFTQGATETGHVVERVDLRDKKVRTYTGCIACGHNGPCVQKDDNEQIEEAIPSANVIAPTMPLYHFRVSTQLKTVVDRFRAYSSSIDRKNMKSALLTAVWNADSRTFDVLEAHYRTLAKYFNFQDTGMVLGKGCGSPPMTNITSYPEMVYKSRRSC